MRCEQCSAHVDMVDLPTSTQVWCSEPCSKAWHDAHPEARKGWIDIADLSRIQRAELDGILGKGGKA